MVGHHDHVGLFSPVRNDRCWILHLWQEAAKADSSDRGHRSLYFPLFHTQFLCNGHRRRDLDCRALVPERIGPRSASRPGKRWMFDDQDPFGVENQIDAAKARLDDLKLKTGQRFEYLFDFGDSWWHEVVVETISPVRRPPGTGCLKRRVHRLRSTRASMNECGPASDWLREHLARSEPPSQ